MTEPTATRPWSHHWKRGLANSQQQNKVIMAETDTVMVGSFLAGTDPSSGEMILRNGRTLQRESTL